MGASSYGTRGVVRLPGVVAMPGPGKVIYVHHNVASAFNALPSEFTDSVYTTIAAALDSVENDAGDTVQLLPGHAENITASYLSSARAAKRGYTIRGPASGKPATLTWSAAGSTWAPSGADIVVDGGRSGGDFGIIMNWEPGSGTVTVTAPVAATGVRNQFRNLKVRAGTDANNKVTIGMAVTTEGCVLDDVHVTSATAAECTSLLDITAADNLVMRGCYFAGATSNVAVGVVRFVTTASLNIRLTANTYINRKAASTCAVTGLAAVSGVSQDELFHYLDNVSLTTWLTSAGIMAFNNPRVVNLAGEIGALGSPVSA